MKLLCNYVEQTLDIDLKPAVWNESNSLPFYLRDRYTIYQAILLDTPCLFLVDKKNDEQTPATIRKQVDQIQAKASDRQIIYTASSITAFNRKRLIEKKVPFIVPGKQMYLPMLAIDFREHFRKIKLPPTQFSPSTQVVLLHALLKNPQEDLRPIDLANQYGYSHMTMSRAFDEIERSGIGEITVTGRERRLFFEDDKENVWTKAAPFMQSPIKKKTYIKLFKNTPAPGVLAGLSALATFSLLAEPVNPVYALNANDWKIYCKDHTVIITGANDDNACDIEIWSYAPAFFAENNVVDRLSLYLSLRHENDERIESALETMMQEIKW